MIRMSRVAIACLFASSFIPTVVTSAAIAQAPAVPATIVGVWYQPIASFDKWKARGINTLFGYEHEGNSVTRDQWTAAAREHGLFYITQASDNLKRDAADPWLLAWMHKDEPDGAGSLTPQQLAEDYAKFKAAGDKPVVVVFDGHKMQWRPESDYADYARAADWLLHDFYPLNYGDGPEAIPVIGKRLDLLRRVAPRKRHGVVVETSDQLISKQEWTHQRVPNREKNLSEYMRGPTPQEIAAEFAVARQHGATIFLIFPDRIGLNWEAFDGQTDDQAAATAQQMKQLQTAPAMQNAQPARARQQPAADERPSPPAQNKPRG
jgi:hypothetical protein